MTTTITSVPYSDRIMAVHALASLLEKLETSLVRPDPAQYRSVAQRLKDALVAAQAEQVPGLQAMLDVHPAASTIYENLNYESAGLCCTPVERSVDTELATRALLARLQQPQG